MRRRLSVRLAPTGTLLVALGALLAALAYCAPAHATFTPFALVSANPAKDLEADYAFDPAISADGRYVAFTGSVASQPGVYRKNIATGAIELVAAGNHAGAPSISADGRYVSFTSDQNPETGAPDSTKECSSVYVRDMQIEPKHQPAQPISTQLEPWLPEAGGAFTLASARNASSESLTYVFTPNVYSTCGAAAAARVALSADGQEVAFTVLSPSDLSGECKVVEETETCPTPAYQVAVRNLETQTTTLVSSTLASQGGTPQPVPNGAALSGPTVTPETSLAGGGHARLAVGGSTAAISADGSTVAWMGIEVAAQVSVAQPLPTITGYPNSYAEPLWRRIADGPAAPTRRVLAGDDPSAPECPPACAGGVDLAWDTQGIGGNEYFGAAPQFGSYTSRGAAGTGFAPGAGLADPLAAVTPQLSDSGMTVALLSTQPNYGEDPNFGLFNGNLPPPANAFVVDMTPGLTRAQAITRLTNWASLDFDNPELAAPVTSIALSGDGTRVVFSTERIAFPLAPPALITPTLSQAAVAQLYEANLVGGTLALVSFGYDGQPANGEVYAAALSEDGRAIALSSGATNLVYGVVNQGSDVYLTEEIHSPAAPGQQIVSPTPPWPAAAIPWSISATATPSPDGTLVLYVSVPGAGRLSASAVSAVDATKPASVRRRKAAKRRVARRASVSSAQSRSERRNGKGNGSTHTRKTRKPAAARNATIADTAASAKGSEVLELHLIPAARYDSLLQSSRYGLYATVTVTFTAPGHRTLRETLRVSFPRRPPIYNLPTPRYPLPKHKLPTPAASKPKHGKPRHTHKERHR